MTVGGGFSLGEHEKDNHNQGTRVERGLLLEQVGGMGRTGLSSGVWNLSQFLVSLAW